MRNKRLDFEEFESILRSNMKNKYDLLRRELDLQKDSTLANSQILQNCVKLFKRLKYENMVR